MILLTVEGEVTYFKNGSRAISHKFYCKEKPDELGRISQGKGKKIPRKSEWLSHKINICMNTSLSYTAYATAGFCKIWI